MDPLLNFKCGKFIYQDNTLPRELCERLNVFRLDDALTDVEIEVGKEIFRCHRVILAAASPYYRAMFQHDPEAKERSKLNLPLPNTSASVFREILEFMYTSRLTITSENVMDVLELADFLQFRDIVHCCAEILLQNIKANTAVTIFQLADAHLCQALAHTARMYIKENFQDIFATEDFVKLSFEMLTDILSNQTVIIKSEEKLLRALCTWIEGDKEERKHYVGNIFEFVNFGSVSKDCIEESQTLFPFLETVIKDREVIDSAKEILDGSAAVMNRENVSQPKRPSRNFIIVPENANKHMPIERHLLLYSVHTGKWSKLTKLPFSDTVQLQRATVIDNCIYITGGEVNGIPTNRVLRYDVLADTWSEVAPMHRARFNHATTEAMGYLYVFGGDSDNKMHSEYDIVNSLERYNPQTNEWDMLEAMDSSEPDVQAGFHGRYSVANCDLVHLGDFLYVIGGSQTSRMWPRRRGTAKQLGDPKCSKHQNVECYNLETNTWSVDHQMTRVLSLHSMNLSHGTCFPYSGLLLLIDEDMKGKKMKLYNPVTHDLWDFVQSQGQHRFGSYVIQNDVLYAIGGMCAFDGVLRGHDLVHRTALNTTEAEWEMLDPLPFAVSHYTGVTVSNHV